MLTCNSRSLFAYLSIVVIALQLTACSGGGAVSTPANDVVDGNKHSSSSSLSSLSSSMSQSSSVSMSSTSSMTSSTSSTSSVASSMSSASSSSASSSSVSSSSRSSSSTSSSSVSSSSSSSSSASTSSSSSNSKPSQFQSNYPLQIIQPRPNLTTANRFYKAYPGLDYNVRLAVTGGAYPFTYSLKAAPSGMTINSSTGTIDWPNPVTTGSPCTITAQVQDQEGSTQAVTWTITVTTSGFIFVDAVNGHKTNKVTGGTADGTIGKPFQTINDWYAESDGTTTNSAVRFAPYNSYAGYFIYYRAGTYNINTFLESDISSVGRMQNQNYNKPVVWLGYPGEKAIMDWQFTNSIAFSGADNLYFDNLEFRNMSYYGIQTGGEGNNQTFRRLTMHEIGPAYGGTLSSGSNNQSLIRFVSGAPDSGNYTTIQDNKFYDIDKSYVTVGYYMNNVLVEDNTIYNSTATQTPGIGPKDSTNMWFIRHNNIYNFGQVGIWVGMYNNVPVSDVEISFNNVQSTSSPALWINQNAQPTGGKVYVFRNTFQGTVEFDGVTTTNGPFYVNNNVIINNNSGTNHITITNNSTNPAGVVETNNLVGIPSDNIVDSSGNLTSAFSSYLGQMGWQQ